MVENPQSQFAEDNPDGFVNPYNFVRVCEPTDLEKERSPLKATHERFHKGHFTGKMRCRLTTVAPLFVPNPESKTQLVNAHEEHYARWFFRYKGDISLPALSIKGMLRNVYETLTSSCFSQFGTAQDQITFREKAGQIKVQPGIVLKLPHQNGAKGLLLRCDTAYWAAKDYNEKTQYVYDNTNPNNKLKITNIVNFPDKYKNSSRVFFLPDTTYPYKKKGTPIKFDLYFARPGKDNQKGAKCGYLKTTGPCFNKKFERLFYSYAFDTLEDLPASTKKLPSKIDELMKIDSERTNTEKIIYEFDHNEARKFNAISGKPLEPGDMIYFEKSENTSEDGNETPRACHLTYVNVARSLFNKNPHELLNAYSRHLTPCTKIDKLCPACRLFGAADVDESRAGNTNDESSGEDAGKESTSLMGRLRIENIRKDPERGRTNTDVKTLKILGSPKETATNFYLINANHDNSKAVIKKSGRGYDGSPPPIIRGRKFYWHQCDAPPHQLISDKYTTTDMSNQNITAEVLEAGAVFEFDLYFENLEPAELALLYWTLHLQGGMLHKLGRGKPLGLGSVKIDIIHENSFFIDPEARYLDIDAAAIQSFESMPIKMVTDAPADRAAPFRISLEAGQNGKTETIAAADLYARDTIDDLIHIMTPQPHIFDNIKYPPPISGEQGYDWFMRNTHTALKTIGEIITAINSTPDREGA